MKYPPLLFLLTCMSALGREINRPLYQIPVEPKHVAAMDVPAIQVEKRVNWDVGKDGELLPFSKGCELLNGALFNEDSHMEYGNVPACVVKRWTCSDKSRFLLTAEDGTRHCIKFNQEAQ